MKFLIITLGLAFGSSNALADGFICQNSREALSLQVYNKTAPKEGTRTPAVMILSELRSGRVIARFTQANLTLLKQKSIYIARVDHRFNDSNRKEEKVADSSIGELSHFNLDLDFSYARPIEHGEFVRGSVNFFERNGAEFSLEMDCTRYLKN